MVSLTKRKQAKSEQRHRRNKKYKTKKNHFLKEIRASFEKTSDLLALKELFNKTQKVLDQAVAKGVIHKNNAARQKSKLSRRINQISSQITDDLSTKQSD